MLETEECSNLYKKTKSAEIAGNTKTTKNNLKTFSNTPLCYVSLKNNIYSSHQNTSLKNPIFLIRMQHGYLFINFCDFYYPSTLFYKNSQYQPIMLII